MNRPYRRPRSEPDGKRVPSWLAAAIVAVSLAAALGACSNGTASMQNQDCARLAHGTLPWGYYPGYGCGPVPRAQTVFP